jgi:predicted nucleic acid-binding Zn ribbon protein
MESRKLYELKCPECGKIYEVMCTFEELKSEVEGTNKCTCGALTKQKLGFGYGKFNGAGFTKRTT